MSETVLCTPLRVEHAALRPAARSMRIVRTGVGPRRAEIVAARLKATRGPGGPVLVAGVGGGLDPGIRPGDLVVASEVRGAGPPVGVPSAALLAGALRRLGLTVHVGPVRSGPRIVRTAGPVAADGSLAVDMESYQLAGAGGPFAVVRSVVDTVEQPLWRMGTPARGVRALRALRACVPALEQWVAATGPREILLAAPRSFCAGVARAIDTVEAALQRYGPPVYVRRQIVHNAHVVRELQGRGAVFVEEADEVPPGAVLVFAAHGVSPAVRRAAADRDLTVVDATCPLVTKVHTEIRRYAARGDTVFLIGHADHEEVQGSLGEAPSDVVVVEDAEAAARVQARDPERVAYTMQTTLAVDEAEQIADVLRDRFPHLAGPRTDDICYATTNRQLAVRAVAREVDVVLAVGSTNSSNSRRLAEVAEREGAAAHLVDDVSEIDLRWLAGARRVGITAGASAPPHLVDQVVTGLAGLGPVTVREIRHTDEDVTFALPKEVS
jgi:4-hydroxy-3-methylbut-2-en-1-yl diphosphate reductase